MSFLTIGELAAAGVLQIGDGYRTKRSEHAQQGFRIIRVADVMENAVSFTGPDFVSAKYAKAIGTKAGQPGDILLTTKGTVGRVAVLPDTSEHVVYSPQLCFFRVLDSEVIDPAFLRYWFSSAEFWHQAADRMNNTDMAAYINLADIRSLKLAVPDISEQRCIAEVLGALDDKIAANTKLALAADDLATTEFHKAMHGVALSDQTFGDLATVSGGGTPSTKVLEYWDGDIPWATPTDVTPLQGPFLESTKRMISQTGLSACASPLYPAGSILMTSRATIGAFAIAQTPMAVNQGFIVVQPTDPTLNFWVFHEMRSRVDEFISLANGATFLELSRGNFKKLKVRLAEPKVMEEFGQTAGRLHAVAKTVLRENTMLAQARDTLLPQLMSGKLRVKDAQKVLVDAGV
ncbi:restriction endonuclease subunit S [Paenarthrobacter sp. OM7]|uniref:restriction endonuclease subunit S n=1 Tax=Paenarthrobacter sp. OM7 TaxID=3041264 RepID=UPI002468BD35|nr:restriction endonuclease subunit S [Paenarthrobacter sp. OM7]WGM20952.1 restriction endonuclease subunit S [Paenarthrobacter sp. OM7]